MNRERVFIGLGSNVGNRLAHLRKAVEALNRLPGIRVVGKSPVYETAPVGPRQRDFLNAVAELRSDLAPGVLLASLKGIEKKMGRRVRRRWGPREIDLDLLHFGRRRRRSAALALPHPRWRERRFVLAPLAALAPRWKDPETGQTAAALSRKLTDPGQRIRLYKPSFL